MRYWSLKNKGNSKLSVVEKKHQMGSRMFAEPTIVKKNFAIQMINRLHQKIYPKSKANIDPAPKTRPFMDPDHETGYRTCEETLPNFELRYLNNVVNVDQF